ncbi:MAG: DNA starvation/stationary phase protection protein [Bdellovibrionota bacterium]
MNRNSTTNGNSRPQPLGQPNVGMNPSGHNTELVHNLNEILANEFVLFTRTLNYHWNITGPRFQQVHRFLEEHYRKILEMMDQLAERVRVMGARPLSTVHEMEHQMSLKEKPGRFPDTDGMLRDLVADHSKIMEQLKDTISREDFFTQDPVSEDFLIQLLKEHELMAWMIRSHFSETNSQQ